MAIMSPPSGPRQALLRKGPMKRPTARIPVAVLTAAAAFISLAPSRARADLPGGPPGGFTALPGTGIVVSTGDVQVAGDPHWLYQFDVILKPDPAVHDFIQKGDNFTVTLANNTGLISGTNGQPPDWAATSFTASSVTWSYIGDNPITAMTPLDPPPGPSLPDHLERVQQRDLLVHVPG